MIVGEEPPDKAWAALHLDDVVVVKPHRGGVAFWRWVKDFLRVGMHRVIRIEFTPKKSFYIFPADAFEKRFEELSDSARFLESVRYGNAVWIHVEKGVVIAPKDRVKEHVLVVEKDPFGLKKVSVDGRQMVKEPRWRSASLSEDLWSLERLPVEEVVEEEGDG